MLQLLEAHIVCLSFAAVVPVCLHIMTLSSFPFLHVPCGHSCVLQQYHSASNPMGGLCGHAGSSIPTPVAPAPSVQAAPPVSVLSPHPFIAPPPPAVPIPGNAATDLRTDDVTMSPVSDPLPTQQRRHARAPRSPPGLQYFGPSFSNSYFSCPSVPVIAPSLRHGCHGWELGQNSTPPKPYFPLRLASVTATLISKEHLWEPGMCMLTPEESYPNPSGRRAAWLQQITQKSL